SRANATDLVGIGFREPEITVRSGRNKLGITGRGRDHKLCDAPAWRDLTDLISIELREPKVAVPSLGDAEGSTLRVPHTEFGNDAAGRNPSYLTDILREPE